MKGYVYRSQSLPTSLDSLPTLDDCKLGNAESVDREWNINMYSSSKMLITDSENFSNTHYRNISIPSNWPIKLGHLCDQNWQHHHESGNIKTGLFHLFL